MQKIFDFYQVFLKEINTKVQTDFGVCVHTHKTGFATWLNTLSFYFIYEAFLYIFSQIFCINIW